MPFEFNLDRSLCDIKEVDIDVPGWKNPLTIEYGIAQVNMYDLTLSVIWRVKGSRHCFTISEQRLNTLSNGNYKQHFEKALAAFRKDYLSWFTKDEYEQCDWKYQYKDDIGRFIEQEDKDNGSENKQD